MSVCTLLIANNEQVWANENTVLTFLASIYYRGG
jgi:hypothetical protein